MRYRTLILCLLISSCAVGPNYSTPDSKLPDTWLSGKADDQAEMQANWWKNFNDPVLDTLIDKAAHDSFDLKIAEARIAEARATRSGAVSDLLPKGDVKASANRQANQFVFPGGGPEMLKPFNTFETGFDASWELDLFGKNQRALESASDELQAAKASRDDIKISLLAEVARNYIDIRKAQAQIALANDTIDSYQKTVDINNDLFSKGSIPKLNVIQAESELSNAKAQLPKYQNTLAQAEYSTDVLLGEQPGYTHKVVAEIKPIPVAKKEIVLSAPANIIANRPDIKMAERKLASATAQQGEAVAQFFPDVSVSGFVGLLNLQSGSLLEAGSKSWSATGGVLWPILNYGSLSANLDATNARQQAALAEYQKSIIGALSDVEGSVTQYQKREEHRAAISDAVDKYKHAADISNNRYQNGMTNFLEVLDAKRSLYIAQQDLLDTEGEATADMVAVYKNLGGAWEVPATAKTVVKPVSNIDGTDKKVDAPITAAPQKPDADNMMKNVSDSVLNPDAKPMNAPEMRKGFTPLIEPAKENNAPSTTPAGSSLGTPQSLKASTGKAADAASPPAEKPADVDTSYLSSTGSADDSALPASMRHSKTAQKPLD